MAFKGATAGSTKSPPPNKHQGPAGCVSTLDCQGCVSRLDHKGEDPLGGSTDKDAKAGSTVKVRRRSTIGRGCASRLDC